jgi:hypothetical protein
MTLSDQDVGLMRLAHEIENRQYAAQNASVEERAKRVTEVYKALLKAIQEGRKLE